MINNVTIVEENWLAIPGYEDLYEVSDQGRIRSKNREVWNGKAFYVKKGRVLRKSKTTTGYWKVELYKDGKKKSLKVHRLVATSFIDNPLSKPNINHIDGNPLNNHVSNLEWCTQLENVIHGYETGLNPSNFHKNKDKILNEYISNPNVGIGTLRKKYGFSHVTLKTFLESNGFKVKSSKEIRDKYKINRKELVKDFETGMSNKEIAKKWKTNSTLIATYRHKYKKGELIV